MFLNKQTDLDHLCRSPSQVPPTLQISQSYYDAKKIGSFACLKKVFSRYESLLKLVKKTNFEFKKKEKKRKESIT